MLSAGRNDALASLRFMSNHRRQFPPSPPSPPSLEREFQFVNDLVDRLSEAQLGASGPEQFRARVARYLRESESENPKSPLQSLREEERRL